MDMVGIYIRESSKRQGDGPNLETQRSQGIAWAQSQSLPYTIYEDIASSRVGAKTRVSWTRLQADISTQSVTIVWFWKFERLGRDAEETEKFKKLLKKTHCKFYSGEDHRYINLSNSGEDLITTIQGKQAEIDNARRAEYIRSAIHARLDNGQRRFCRLYGYTGVRKIDTSGKKPRITHDWVINEAEADIIRLIFSKVGSGESTINGTATYLNNIGIKPPYAKQWTHDRVARIIKQLHYTGNTYDTAHNVIPSKAYPAIIPYDQWLAVQAYYRDKLSPRSGRHAEYIGSGIIRCGVCGEGYTHCPGRKYPNGNWINKPTYIHRYPHGKRSCHNRSIISQAITDNLLGQIYVDAMGNPAAILDHIRREIEELDQSTANERSLIAAKIREAERYIDNLLDLIGTGSETIPATIAAKKIAEKNEELQALKIAQKKLEEKLAIKHDAYKRALAEFSAKKIEEYYHARPKIKNKMLKEIITSVILTGDILTITLIDGRTIIHDYALLKRKKITDQQPQYKDSEQVTMLADILEHRI